MAQAGMNFVDFSKIAKKVRIDTSTSEYTGNKGLYI